MPRKSNEEVILEKQENNTEVINEKAVVEEHESLEKEPVTPEMILEEETVIAANDDDTLPDEPVVPADIEEQGTEVRLPHSSRPRTDRVVMNMMSVGNNIAIGDITEDLSKDVDTRTRDQIEEDEWHEIQKYARNHGLLWGIVRAVTPENAVNSFSVITTVYGKQVKIAENSFIISDSLDYDRYFQGQTDFVKKEMRKRRLESYIGALIPFTIIYARREKIKDESSIRGFYYRYFIGGSRTEGTEIVQDYWFFHNKRRFSRTPKKDVREGMIVENANVLTSHEHGITAEICGVETYIERFELITTRYFENAAEAYKPGDKISVMITKIRFNDEPGKPKVVLGASVRRMMEDNGKAAFDEIMIGGLYRGTVSRFSKGKRNYVILLDVGVTAVVSPDEVEGRIPLDIGSTVTVRVRIKYEEMMMVTGRVVFIR